MPAEKTMRENRTEIIQDLIRIHRERITAYMKLNKWTDNSNVSKIVSQLIQESRNNLLELRGWLYSAPLAEPADRAHQNGELYTCWPGISKISPGCQISEMMQFIEEGERTLSLLYMKLLCRRGIFSREIRKTFSRHLSNCQKRTSQLRECLSCPETEETSQGPIANRLTPDTNPEGYVQERLQRLAIH